VQDLSLDPEWEFYKEKKRPTFIVPYKRNLYDQEMKDAVMKVLDAASVTQGEVADLPETEQRLFENEFAYFCGCKYALMFGSALHGLYLLFRLQGFSKGDEVIMAPNIEPANANIIEQAGGRPVFVDADEDTLNMDVTKIEKKITNKTKAIHPIHGHGHPTDMDQVMEIARKHNLYVVEDATHATGCKYKGRRLPVGHAAVFGMVVKCLWLPATGSMMVTDDDATEEKLRMLMSWPGRRAPAEVTDFKGKGIIHATKTISDDISAAVGRIQLRHLDEYTEAQRRNAKMYTELLNGLPLILPKEKNYAQHCFLRYVTRTEERDALQSYLKKHGIDSRVIYKTPAHLYAYYRENYGYKKGDFPVAEKIKETEIGLPEPTKDRTKWEIEYTASKVKEFFAK
jgi:dTDP-4-amino-4,6-dideoxygalactose transaminase